MKIGLPRQNTLITWPSVMGARSTSIGAPAAMVDASGFICATSGTSTAAAPIAPTAPVPMKRKSRRVGSAEDVIVTVQASPRPGDETARAGDPSGEISSILKGGKRTGRPVLKIGAGRAFPA